ncbi:AzlD domain-containing protein [Tepidibacillus infernus]|uniref:Branched-chain amino acid transporter n=1 Tax=Tepidibacillus decaturensis TaxID=1413211 RepID=A0A135L1C3_9BACI|nr:MULTISPECIES: AzlD domain-containing protein [Tepidibacillus]KXG42765.1 hypothetical protein U473_00920 [Tepidibacillus decaturensis]GBF12356.1 branched-chain amino acid transport protein [Tepidibacillus sp. HK-1]
MNTWILIFAMFIVTYLPRMFPMLFKQFQFPNWLNRWLKFVPYAVLGALIFPGIMEANPSHPTYGLIAGIIGAIIAWFYSNLILVVISSLMVMLFLQFIF